MQDSTTTITTSKKKFEKIMTNLKILTTLTKDLTTFTKSLTIFIRNLTFLMLSLIALYKVIMVLIGTVFISYLSKGSKDVQYKSIYFI